MVSNDDILQELNLCKSYIENLHILAFEKVLDKYVQDIQDDLKLKDEEYKITPNCDLFLKLRKRTSRNYEMGLVEILKGKEHPFDFDLSGIDFQIKVGPEEGSNEYINFKSGSYGFDKVMASLGDMGNAARFMNWVLFSGITYIGPGELSDDEEKENTFEQLSSLKVDLSCSNHPFEILTYRICSSILKKYSN